MNRLKVYWRLGRPFTMVAPALGMVSGAITALGAEGGLTFEWWMLRNMLLRMLYVRLPS